MARLLRKLTKAFLDYIEPPEAPKDPLPFAAAYALADRGRISDLLSYRDFDDEYKLVMLDNGTAPAAGFGLAVSPFMLAGIDSAQKFESILNNLPADSVVQFVKLSTPQVQGFIDTWTNARLEKNSNPLLRQLALRRRDFYLTTAVGPSMLPQERLHPRMTYHFVFVRIPYKGDPADKAELAQFRRRVVDIRSSVQGALESAAMHTEVLDEEAFKLTLRELLNPQMDPTERRDRALPAAPLNKDIIERETRVRPMRDGTLSVSSQAGTDEVRVVCMTVDAKPPQLFLPEMAKTLGSPLARDERIAVPYYAYTTIHVLDADKAKDRLTVKLGALNKQTMSESAWFRSMLGSLFEQRDNTQMLLQELNSGRRAVRAYCGINLYCDPQEHRLVTDYVKGLWRNAGFRISEERYITLPVFLASLPLQYIPELDPPNKGLQRAEIMTSFNAANMVQVQGDWRGTSPKQAGALLVSRQGQLACVDLLAAKTNMNAVVVATSGAGKSFLANELVGDFLSRGGMVRLIDVGRSYAKFCARMNGENIVFSPENPMSLNPFSGVDTPDKLNELAPMLKDLLRQMAYPLTTEEDTPSWQYAAIEEAIQLAWAQHGSATELRHVYETLNGMPDTRAHDVAFQLKPYAIGRYARWFSGPRTVSFNNDFVILELEELKQDPQLQAVVLTLMIHQVTKEMFLSGKERPKMLAIDEAWDLMGGLKTGRFIETAFRRARKYNGIAVVITQSFEDFEKSPAARAAIQNAAWQFILAQKPESLQHAVDNKRIVSDPTTIELIASAKPGAGFSEVFVRDENGAGGVYRFVTDKHSYYTFTTRAEDDNDLTELLRQGKTLEQAIDILAMRDYQRMWGTQQ
jgi:conjugal transfer ATP-binding protein TraC